VFRYETRSIQGAKILSSNLEGEKAEIVELAEYLWTRSQTTRLDNGEEAQNPSRHDDVER
jgi:hypothetical protein